ncbi:MAG: response regulator [Campylobacterota bacterium]|nr:response regulator [Campylobacterota bacterium]
MKNDLTLLYVEDDKLVRENFVQIFEIYFNKVISTDNGNDVLSIYKDNHIDIAILDISIPGINGLSLASEIRKVDDEILIIMLTAYSDKEKLLKAVNLQLFSYLIKPIDLKSISNVLDQAISKLSAKDIVNLAYNYKWNIKSKNLFYNDKEVKISKNEKKLITCLYENYNKYFTSCEIEDLMLNNSHNKKSGDDTACNNVVQLISRFKKKMLKLHNKENFFIESVYGLGYKIVL